MVPTGCVFEGIFFSSCEIVFSARDAKYEIVLVMRRTYTRMILIFLFCFEGFFSINGKSVLGKNGG